MNRRSLFAAGAGLMLAGRAPEAHALAAPGVRRYLAQEAATGFSGAVLVSAKGKDLLRGGYGLANAEHGIANTAATPFKIGSISKTMTALGLLRLVADGRASLDDAVGKHLPRTPETWRGITLRHLLDHSSGIPDIVRLPDFMQRMRRATTLDETIDAVRPLPLDFAPGAKAEYGNSGFIVAARLIEILSGVAYPEFLQKTVYRPLGMNASGYADNEAIIPGRASGYTRQKEGLRNASFIDMSLPMGAGAEYSTVLDLQRYWRGVAESRLLPRRLTTEMLTPGRGGYGLAWAIGEVGGRRCISHIGDINGFGSYLAAFPDQDVLVIVLSNVERTPVKTMALKMAELAMA